MTTQLVANQLWKGTTSGTTNCHPLLISFLQAQVKCDIRIIAQVRDFDIDQSDQRIRKTLNILFAVCNKQQILQKKKRWKILCLRDQGNCFYKKTRKALFKLLSQTRIFVH